MITALRQTLTSIVSLPLNTIADALKKKVSTVFSIPEVLPGRWYI